MHGLRQLHVELLFALRIVAIVELGEGIQTSGGVCMYVCVHCSGRGWKDGGVLMVGVQFLPIPTPRHRPANSDQFPENLVEAD